MYFKISIVALGALVSVGLAPSSAHAVESSKAGDNQAKQAKQTMVTVKAGDTLETIASTHGRTYVQLFNANESITHPDVIDVGDKIRIPAANEELPNRYDAYAQQQAAAAATYSAPAAVTYASTPDRTYTAAPVNSTSYYVGNGMWCTDYVASKRSDISVYGNAGYNWVSAAQAEGKATGSAPKAGAVAVTNGHVAYVESVNADGSYVVSEMGWNYTAGQYNQRTVQPGTFGAFIY
jgi:surface antigen